MFDEGASGAAVLPSLIDVALFRSAYLGHDAGTEVTDGVDHGRRSSGRVGRAADRDRRCDTGRPSVR